VVKGTAWCVVEKWERSKRALGEGFQDRAPQRPSNGRSPWVLEKVPRRWRGTIPLVARVIEDAVAAGLFGGRRSRAPRVRISVRNPGGQRAACYCRETLYPTDLDLGALVYRFEGSTLPSRCCRVDAVHSSPTLQKMARVTLLMGLLLLSEVRGSIVRTREG
jgi:hypothetical protein